MTTVLLGGNCRLAYVELLHEASKLDIITYGSTWHTELRPLLATNKKVRILVGTTPDKKSGNNDISSAWIAVQASTMPKNIKLRILENSHAKLVLCTRDRQKWAFIGSMNLGFGVPIESGVILRDKVNIRTCQDFFDSSWEFATTIETIPEELTNA